MFIDFLSQKRKSLCLSKTKEVIKIHRPRKIILFVAISCGLFYYGVIRAPFCYSISSINVPVDHWSYEALEKLAGFGLLNSEIKGTRPYTRMEMGRLVFEATKQKELSPSKGSDLADYVLGRLKKEFQEEVSAWSYEQKQPAKTFLKPLENFQARYVYTDGEPRNNFTPTGSQIEAKEGTPLVYNNEGVVYGENHNFSFQFSSSLRFKGFFSGHIEPIFLARQNQGDLEDFDDLKWKLLKGYAKISHWNLELEGGRDSLWWGQGRHGSLLLTNHAKPLGLFKVSNPTPTLLPWFFRYLGAFKYSLFFSRLGEDRVVSNPWLGGIRFNFKPVPNVEVGAATTFMFNGEGVPNLAFSDISEVLTLQSPENSNMLAVLDFRFRFPFLRNAEFYAEYGGEDTGGPELGEEFMGIGDIGFLLGFYFPRVTEDGRTDMRLEFAHNSHKVDDDPGFWYGHGVYRSGYTHEGLIMGHHMGGDAMDFFVRVNHYLRNYLKLGLDFDFMKRGLSLSPVEEKINQVGTDATYEIKDRFTLRARYAYEKVQNFDLMEGEDRQNHLFMTVFQMDF